MFMRSRQNLHTCKLPLDGSRSPIIKYARGSHIGFAFPLYKPDTFVRASNAQVRCVHYLHNFKWGCRRGLRHFWECRVHLGYGPSPEPTLKRPCATLVRLVGRKTNTVEIKVVSYFLDNFLREVSLFNRKRFYLNNNVTSWSHGTSLKW